MEGVKEIAIFGSTGMTGMCVLDAGLNLGLKMKILLRDPSRLPDRFHNKVEIVEGNVIKMPDVEKTISGVDGVVVVLGTRNNLEPTTEMSTGMNNIITVMNQLNPDIPISVCLSSFLFFAPGTVPPAFKHINAEHERMLKSLEASNLKFIAVHPPHISDQPKAEYVTKHGGSPGGRVISKYELADFLINCLTMKEHYRQRVGLCSKSALPEAS